jgi:uncharacterized membrane protein YraQ (UPF0718 family)
MVHDMRPGYGSPGVPQALLIISLLAFAVGPALYAMAGRARATLAGLDGFVMITVAGLALVHIIPHAVVTAGAGALAIALAGFIGPGLVEHRLERAARQTHTAALVLALAGLTVHEFFDGVGLAQPFYDQDTGLSVLAVAVVLHRLPIAITVWWLLCPLRGPRVAAAVLCALGAATVLGYLSVDAVASLVDTRWLGLLEALIAGSLLHVVVHRPSPLSTPDQGRRERLSAGIGALLGLAAVVALGSEHHIPLHGHDLIGFRDIFTALALEIAPFLLLAFALAGVVRALLPRSATRWLRTGNPSTEALRGVVFALAPPSCSCRVIPLYHSLVAQSAPVTAAMAFLVATPGLGIDSILVSLPLLGAKLTLVRLVAAILVALVAGAVIGRLIERRRTGGSSTSLSRSTLEATAASDVVQPPLAERIRAGLRFGFGEMVDHTAPWIVFGIAIASLAEPALHGSWLVELPWGIDVLLFALLGMPLYTCAAGATPVVAVLVHMGISPGAGLALLLTGPVISATMFGALERLHGPRIAAALGGVLFAAAVVLGLVVNLALPEVDGIALYQEAQSDAGLFEILCLSAFTLILALSVLRQGPRAFTGQILSPYGEAHSHDDDHAHAAD